MSIESDTKLIFTAADKLLVQASKLTGHDANVAVAALSVAMMCLAKGSDIPRSEINELIDIAENNLEEMV